ncbi:Small ribosomal subunit protein bS18 OS=Tsukamurella paurometabola (strain ATCC 8368 / DSM /CCUG 35730 / CIP 100753 / JCM 10117 / KCTC 9821 / NBRC 16120/ NCIMB 702349 / NCTC 13040) OX=521096 GN=rpsR PE=3 SV=1 [Tsukamurella paurometabola]|uniref:Small ribosomal subunit protein bS18 n=1 Tax=Tsukamurella paurometabola (strain ATCC 8368 / DSM 20162 / CCUG 35730 / CIP 100753 / JCM 10117 / KCTC 9821 / NBRC 16120 / NCIMB 702349 / NCTC 13040) TaxID=521096 RepID=D5UVU7_TSUPD|nr:ribosomal protein S18 [Tsukamurella paurometabola DSM 20162]SUP37508.1 30S ribosomal protein S18 1 [Tsukamurella paurometabola]
MTKPRRTSVRTPAARKGLIKVPEGALDYKNVTYLRTFLNERGKLRSRAVTRLSPQDQRALALAVKNAREMALLPYATRR